MKIETCNNCKLYVLRVILWKLFSFVVYVLGDGSDFLKKPISLGSEQGYIKETSAATVFSFVTSNIDFNQMEKIVVTKIVKCGT